MVVVRSSPRSAAFDEFIKEAHTDTRASLGPVAVLLAKKGRARDVEVDERMRGEAREELPRRLRTAQVTAEVLDVGDIADDLFTILVPERQARHAFEDLQAGGFQLLEFAVRCRAHRRGPICADGAH